MRVAAPRSLIAGQAPQLQCCGSKHAVTVAKTPMHVVRTSFSAISAPVARHTRCRNL